MSESGILERVYDVICDYVPKLDERVDKLREDTREAFIRITHPSEFPKVYHRLRTVRPRLTEKDIVLYTISHIESKDGFYLKSTKPKK